MSIDIEQFHSVFFDESDEHLDDMEQLLMGLDVESPDPEELNSIFRAAHSIKGGSGIFGFDALMNLTHVMENLLDQARNNELSITEQKVKNAYYEGQLAAIGKSQAVIEFNMDGIIQHANDNFLNTVGYTLEEIKGKHHSMFVDPAYRASPEYAAFWDGLRNGTYSSGEYRRVGKDGKEIFIQATYNPILDHNGKPFRVVKFATDITGRTQAVDEIKHVMTRLTEGDLTVNIEHALEGDFAVLGEAINQFINEMRGTITSINDAVETINVASGEIATGNADLSSRTEQQASSFEETASSMEELTGTVKLNAENAEQANGLAAQASKIASQGGEVIGEVVDTMTQINDSAQEISDIIGVIDGLSNQYFSIKCGSGSSPSG